MYETLHINQRVRQRGITNRMIELTLEYGTVVSGKVKLGTKGIKKLLRAHNELRVIFLKYSIKVDLLLLSREQQ